MSDVGFSLGTFSAVEGAPPALGARPFPGVVLGERVVPLAVLAPELSARGVMRESCESLQSLLDDWHRAFPLLQDLVRQLRGGGLPASARDLAQLRVHAPLPKPGTIYCSGANYKKHVAELIVAHQNDERTRAMSLEEKRAWAMALMDRRAESGTPFIFVKPQSSVTGPLD